MKSYKIYIDNANRNCEVSIVDSSRIYHYMLENGHKIIDNPSKADYIIINSCGFNRSHEVRSANLFKKYNSLKKENTSIIIFGCLVKINPELISSLDVYPIDFNEGNKFDEIFYKNTIFENVKPYCDDETKRMLFLKKNIVQHIRYPSFFLSRLMLPFFKKMRLNYQRMIDSITFKNKTLVEISRGCTGNCSYCMIKKARGNVCSRKIKDIITDIKELYNPSKSLFLVADDCGCYGVDIDTNLIDLIYEINKKFPDLSIDLDYLNPFLLERYSDDYIKLFKNVKINFVTIPLQSGSNKILKTMNRNYDAPEVNKIIDKIKKASPKTFIYSHFIIGFPGENWIDFFKTMICAMHFDIPIPFKYSEHKNTASSSLPNHKSNLTISIRYHLSIFYFNFVIFYKLLSYSKF